VKLENTFRVDLPVDDAWALLTDLRRIAPCLPGAHLDGLTDGEYHGALAVKIGPISARYTGLARFLERDDVDHRAVIEARGREQRGNGAASATIVTNLEPEGDRTRVSVSTELSVSGRAAQFGRSLLAEVSESMLSEFASRLESTVHGDGASAGSARDDAARSGASTDARHDGNSLDLLGAVAMPLLRRAALPAACAVLAGLAGWLVGRRR